MVRKWTSGPWTVEHYPYRQEGPVRHDGPCVVFANSDCELHPIADCSCNNTCRDIGEAEANARLIAAAPDLAEALLRLMPYLKAREAMPLRGMEDVVHCIHTHTEFESQITMDDLRAARVALRKAGVEL